MKLGIMDRQSRRKTVESDTRLHSISARHGPPPIQPTQSHLVARAFCLVAAAARFGWIPFLVLLAVEPLRIGLGDRDQFRAFALAHRRHVIQSIWLAPMTPRRSFSSMRAIGSMASADVNTACWRQPPVGDGKHC